MEFRNKNGLTEQEFLAQYKPGDYERPSVTVDMMLLGVSRYFDNLKILLIKRGDHPYMNCWALPGGFVNMDESAYTAACRELKEETGLENIYLEQLYTFSQPNRDPRMRVIDIAYMGLTPIVDVYAGDDAKDAAWFNVIFSDDKLILENLDRKIHIEYSLKKNKFHNGVITIEDYVPTSNSETKLAFDHVEIILNGLCRLRNKLDYTDIAFNLVDEEFTLSDLQRIYELILGKHIYKKNFRDKVNSKIISVGSKGRSIVGNKASMLYKYKK